MNPCPGECYHQQRRQQVKPPPGSVDDSGTYTVVAERAAYRRVCGARVGGMGKKS
jgi:hypothetical protein